MTATEQLTAYAERLERILDEIGSLKDGLKDLKAEIKSSGFNVRALERIVAIRRKDTADKEAEFLNDVLLYAHATGTHIDLVAPERTWSVSPAQGCPAGLISLMQRPAVGSDQAARARGQRLGF